ncbi:galactosyl transferase GMA12/MNN10 family protein [Gramella sp. Hel_I_59]|uniref:hypothetical protein n=1 Tax=Gramella sp. Hel_I_59 TaxID=1249978 RepID=UPI00114E5218|nr:hypothetical protein [Gramella sp. Hel_I_59]TQI71556.1 galactosyl transferase GMA12/MNN10 family protein [Gramella sp. Hel_I_59]
MHSKVLVFSIALEGYSSLFKPCIKTQQDYCKKHNFQYLLIDKTPRMLLPTEAAWLKLFLLRTALQCHYEWVAFIDADCEVRPRTPSFIEEMEKLSEKKIFMSHGFSGRINSGVIFMKNSREALSYLDEVIKNGDKPVAKEDKAPYENGHMIAFGKNNPDIEIIDAEKWNNNSKLNDESFIQHYSGGVLRGKYLEKHSTLRFLFHQKKRLTNLKNFFKNKPNSTSMAEIESLLDYYNIKFPEIVCNH